MKKIVITYGLLAGAIVTLMMGIGIYLYSHDNDLKHSMLIGYSSMILSFSLIFVAVKVFRDKENAGAITFWKAFLIGLYISLIASTIYVAAWAMEYKYIYPDFMDKYCAQMTTDLKKSGLTEAQMAPKLKEMADSKENYKNPVYFTLMTYAEIFPVGLLISLISAGILRRKPRINNSDNL